MEKRLDRRRKYYMILDCETATLPCAADLPADAKQKIAIAKPLIYDLGWQIIDAKGNVYRRRSFLISEIFSVPAVFDTAYYASKRPIYLERLERGEIELTDWKRAVSVLERDLSEVSAVGAYNSMFDFKKAIPFTELYINNLYSAQFHSWLAMQERICENIANGRIYESRKEFESEVFRFHGVAYPLFDLWGLSARHLLNNDEYKRACVNNNWVTASGKYFKTSAETSFRFLENNLDFDEEHTALSDAEIESKIFAEIHKRTKGKYEIGIIYFPFRELGTVEAFLKKMETL